MNQSKNKTKAEERSSHVHTYFDTIYKYIDLYFRYFIIRSNSTKPSIILSQKYEHQQPIFLCVVQEQKP